MEKLGTLASEGFTVAELRCASEKLTAKNCKNELVILNNALGGELANASPAAVLIIRGGVNLFLGDESGADKMLSEQTSLKWDTQALMYGRVVSKKARHNLCYADFEQVADFANRKGTVVSFAKLPCLSKLRTSFSEVLGAKAAEKKIVAEGNLYYDPSQCGIGFHGDAERRIVIAVRLGATMPLHYQWFNRGAPIGNRVILTLHHGDVYVMSEKATGFDWKKKVIPTLRHAAGSNRFTTIKTRTPKKPKKKNEEEDEEDEEDED